MSVCASTNSASSSTVNSVESLSTYGNLPSVKKYDIGNYFSMSKILPGKELYDCISNCFTPDKNFSFPFDTSVPRSQAFLNKWLEEYDWLRYSKSSNGGFCLPCSLFASKSTKFKNQAQLITKPVVASNNSVNSFHRHVNSPNGLHAQCLKDMKSFMLRFEGKILPVNTQVNNQTVKEISKAKKILPSIIDSIILCGHLGIPLRGHRDDSCYHPKAGDYSINSGVG